TAATPVPASARATAAHWRRPVSVSGTSREPAKRRSRTHVVSPCRMTKTLSLATTPPFYPDSHPGPDQPDFPPRACQRIRRVESLQVALEADQFGQNDVRHGANLLERSRRHGVVEVEEGHRPAAAALAAELHAGDVDAVAPAERADAADHAGHVEVR